MSEEAAKYAIKKKTISDYPPNQENPFLDEMHWKEFMEDRRVSKVKTVENAEVVNTETGEAYGALFYRDVDKFTKDVRTFTIIYDKENHVFKDLSSPELNVLMYIFKAVLYNQDIVVMNYDECLKFTGYKTTAPVYNGLAGLMEKRIIAKHYGNAAIFYINPKYFFKGNSVALYVKYMADKNSKKKQ